MCENLVAIKLKKMECDGRIELYYWKDSQNREVDFVIKQGLKITHLIQVCYDASDIKTFKREVDALFKASHELNCENLLLLTETLNWKKFLNRKLKQKIKFMSICEWLLIKEL